MQNPVSLPVTRHSSLATRSNPSPILAQRILIPKPVAQILSRPIAHNRHHHTLLQLPSHTQRGSDIGSSRDANHQSLNPRQTARHLEGLFAADLDHLIL